MKELKKQFLKIIFLLLFLFISFITISVIVFYLDFNADIKFFVVALLSVAMLIITFFIKPRINYYVELIKYTRLRDNSSKPMTISFNPFSKSIKGKLISDNYKLALSHSYYAIYYKVLTKQDDKKFRDGILQLFVFINNSNVSFTNKDIEKSINNIEDKIPAKTKYRNYSLIMIKKNNSLSDTDIKDVNKNVRFDKLGRSNIISVPMMYNHLTKELYYLNNKEVAPTKHYRYALNIISQYFH